MYYTLVFVLLIVSELLSQQSCQRQQKPQAIHCTNLQTPIMYLLPDRVLGYGPDTSSPNFTMGKENHLFPVEEV